VKSVVPRFLIVHHDPASRDLVKDMAERTDAEVTSTSSGTLGAALIRGGSYDLALIDLALPDMGSIELAIFAANENVPTVLLSAHPAMNRQLERSGFPYLPCPFNAAELRSISSRTIHETQINVSKYKASAGRLLTNVAALKLDLTDSQGMINEVLTLMTPLIITLRPKSV
jgi:DNA-binding response OmpR family regulator